MKNAALTIVIVLALAVIACHYCYAQTTVNAKVAAEVLDGLVATETEQLSFGSFLPGNQGGSIMITPNGAVSTTGTVALGSVSPNIAAFSIVGEKNASFSISLPPEPVLLIRVGGTKTMQVVQWNSIPDAKTSTKILESGIQRITVGATLLVGTLENNPPGNYVGSYLITFTYE